MANKLTPNQKKVVQWLIDGGSLHYPDLGQTSYIAFPPKSLQTGNVHAFIRAAHIGRIFGAVLMFRDWSYFKADAYAVRCMADCMIELSGGEKTSSDV